MRHINLSGDQNQHIFNNISNANQDKSKETKFIGLKPLKEVISDIFNTKFKYDTKCKEL